MGLGGIINSVTKKASEIYHSGEKAVKNTFRAAESVAEKALPSVKQFNSAAENMTARLVGSDPVGSITRAAVKNAQTLLPPLPPAPPVPSPVRDFVRNAVATGEKLLDGGKEFLRGAREFGENVVNRAVDAGRSIGNAVVEGVGGFFRSVGEGVVQTVQGIGQTLNPAPLGKLLQGDFAGAWNDFKNNFTSGIGNIAGGVVKATVQPIFDTAVVGLAHGVSAVQTLLGIETPSRALTAQETAELRKIYGDSVDYSQIRIKEGNLGIANGLAPHTVGNTIYIPPGWLDPNNAQQRNELLAHEAAHVWQYQNGGTDYIGESLWNQAVGWLSGQSRNAAYEFETPIKNNVPWAELNPEQQAHLIDQAYAQGLFDDPNARFVYNKTDYTDYVRNAINEMRNGRGAP